MGTQKMQWDKLICDTRFGLEDYKSERNSGLRSDFQRDYDRLIFSSPFRRLQNKTQVFPLPGSIFVHNRLTHSLEVSGVGRSIANEVAHVLMQKYASESWVHKLSAIGEIVAAACLAHDLGNPPFGHSGEKCISTYFSEGKGKKLQSKLSPIEWSDLINFEGNANSFRLLTHQFEGRRRGGFAMTYSMLATIVKYPYSSAHVGTKGKFGFFKSETESFARIADTLGMIKCDSDRYCRHPLVYLLEAADDICYQIMDIEDAHKLKILDSAQVIGLFLNYIDPSRLSHTEAILSEIGDINEKVGYLRSCVVGILVSEVAKAFVEHEEEILRGEFKGTLIDHISPRVHEAYRECSEVAYGKIYCAGDVVDVELAGNQIITFLMEKLIDAVLHPSLNYSKLLLSKFPEQYAVHSETLYGKIQAVVDHMSGMTDVYALDLYRKLNGMSLPAI